LSLKNETAGSDQYAVDDGRTAGHRLPEMRRHFKLSKNSGFVSSPGEDEA
jgi:hypothetical protein